MSDTIIRKYNNESEFEDILIHDIVKFMRDNSHNFSNGWRLYDGEPSQEKDITEDAQSLLSCKYIVMHKPAFGLTTALIIAGSIAASVVATKLFAPKIEAPSTSSRDQSSPTNSLGQRENEAGNGQREPDIWGKVSRHVPFLMQVPQLFFEDNVEIERFALIEGRGKYLRENIRDGDTFINRIPNAKYNGWNPGGNPNNGVAPSVVIGGLISTPLREVIQSREINQSELLPPNDLTTPEIVYSFTGNGNDGIVTISNSDIDLRDYFSAGEPPGVNSITIDGSTFHTSAGTLELFRGYPSSPISKIFNMLNQPLSFDSIYNVNDVQAQSMTLDLSNQDAAIKSVWNQMNGYTPIESSGEITSAPNTGLQTTEHEYKEHTWHYDNTLLNEVSWSARSFNVNIDQVLEGALGPYQVPRGSERIETNLVASSGFYKLVNNKEVSISVIVVITIEQTDETGNPTGSSITKNETISSASKITSPVGVTSIFENPYEYARVSYRRVTNRDKGDNVSNNDQVILRDIYFTNSIPVQNYGEASVSQVEIPSNPASQGVKSREINLDMTRVITPYVGNGKFGPESAVETVAETFIAMSLDNKNGRLTIDEVDADTMLDVQQQLVDYYGSSNYVKVGYSFDSTKTRYQEMANLLWGAVNCNVYSLDAKYKVYPKINREDSSKQFTHRNKIIGTDTKERTYQREFDGVELTYRSNSTGKFETIIEHVNGVSSNNRNKIELSGATQEIQARTRALRELNLIKYRAYSYSFEGDGIARLTVPGERVDNVDHTRVASRPENNNQFRIYDGQVKQQSGLNVELSQPVYFTDGENHTIRFSDSYGNLMEAIDCEKGATPYHVILKSIPSKPIYDGYKKEKTSFTFASEQSRQSMPVIVEDIAARQSGNLKTKQLTCINYDSRYYQDDKKFSHL